MSQLFIIFLNSTSIPFGVKAVISGLLVSHKVRCPRLFVEWGTTDFPQFNEKGWGGDESIIY